MNIETANPVAPAHSVAARRWLQTSHAVIGSQTRRASGKNG